MVMYLMNDMYQLVPFHRLYGQRGQFEVAGVSLGLLPRQATPSVTATCLVLLSSGNTRFSHTSLHPILTKLGHNDRYLDHYSGTKDDGVRGHYGVTGVKKVIFTKKASSPSDYVASRRDLCICSSLTPSTKVTVLKIHPGSFGVTGVKRSFSLKML